jgi:ADP-dependent NAD(P)H-hydrate dehydratase / NAD(P)H-hydrate epimerase
MQNKYWHRQTPAKPLFPDLLWSRPENKQLAGKLLIIGGNMHGFAAAAEAYNESVAAGIGVAKVLLPNALQKTVGPILEAGEFAPSTPSGSFSQKALAECLSLSQWADGVLLAGDFGRNSETAVLLERFLEKYDGQVALTKDAVDYFTKGPTKLLNRQQTTVVVSLAQLQQLVVGIKFSPAITFSMDLLQLVDVIHTFTDTFQVNLIVKHLDTLFVGVRGQVSTTTLESDFEIWRVKTAAHASVWWLQNPTSAFEALTTAVTV